MVLKPLVPTDQTAAQPVPVGGRRAGAMPLNLVRVVSRWRFGARLGLVLGVIVPALLGAWYYGFVASDQYTAETRMVVRTIGLQTQSDDEEGRVTMLGGAAVVQDAHIVVNYLKSNEIVRDLQADIDLRALFDTPLADPLSRLRSDASFEQLHRYWERQTTAYVDGPSGIIEFGVRAFTPEDTVLIAERAVALASDLIETLSAQAKADLLARAQTELDQALVVYIRTLDDLRDMQNEAGILNPLTEAGVSTEVITALFLEKLQTEVELASLQASGVLRSPVIVQLENQIASLDRQITLQREQMAGLQQESGELSAFFAQMNALETERLLAESLYRSASRNFDLAKSTTQRQSTFVSVFAPPFAPTTPSYPERFAFWVVLVAACWAGWATCVLIWAAVEDHRD